MKDPGSAEILAGGAFTAIAALVIVFIIQFFVAKQFEKIAIMKGHPNVHAFAWCFWLGLLGCIYVAALPDISSKKMTSCAKNTGGSYNRYACKSIIKTDKITSGSCFACRENHSSIAFCKIEKRGGITEFPVCDKCFELYTQNSENN